MAASATGWPRPRRRSRLRGPPPSFYLQPHLIFPQLHCFVVTFDRPAGRLLPGPAMTLKQPPCPLHCVADVEQPPDQRLHPGQRPPLVSPSMGERTAHQLSLQLDDLAILLTGHPPRLAPATGGASAPRTARSPAAQPAISRFFAPPSKRPTASSRILSLAALLASVNPPPCAYLTPHSCLLGSAAGRRTTRHQPIKFSSQSLPLCKPEYKALPLRGRVHGNEVGCCTLLQANTRLSSEGWFPRTAARKAGQGVRPGPTTAATGAFLGSLLPRTLRESRTKDIADYPKEPQALIGVRNSSAFCNDGSTNSSLLSKRCWRLLNSLAIAFPHPPASRCTRIH